MSDKRFHDRLVAIQVAVSVPRDQKAHAYLYRSAEQILSVAKPIAAEHGMRIHVSDDIEMVGDRFYVKATAAITDGNDSVTAKGWARESLTRRGLDDSQVTGSASSYARKYALCGLLAIDDASQDPDGHDQPKDADKIDHQMAHTLKDLLERKGANTEKMLEFFKVGRIHELNMKQYALAVKQLKDKPDAAIE